MCCDYEIPIKEEEQDKAVKKEKKLVQHTEFIKSEERPIPA
ncbi:MAG TPA: hypothetical protein VJR94_10130 [Candidatus Nitrosocosmicus sp.]|jgi:hypothetical protein|nr:hypothetical protein [Candidatus Nitrosocosmicus sp.]